MPNQIPLVLLPGLLCDAACWSPQREALADIANIMIADHGLADSIGAMAEQVLAAAPDKFALAGHSMGGRVALEIFRRAPERITHMGLFDTGYEPLPMNEVGRRERAGRMRLLEIARTQGMRVAGEEWGRPMILPSRVDDHALWDDLIAMICRFTPEHFAAQIRALLARPDATDLLPQIRVPTLVLCGIEDAWSPPQRHEVIAAAIPGSTLTLIPECGHMVTMERPEAVNAAMRAWLTREGGTR